MKKIIKTSVLLIGLFGLAGCGTCCDSDSSDVKSETPTPNPTASTTIETSSVDTPTDVSPVTPNVETGEEVETEIEIEVVEEIIPLPPIAVANDSVGIIEIPTCAYVNFSSEGSYDPDGADEKLTYKWTGLHGCPTSDKESFKYRYKKKGLYETTLTVTDEQNLTAVDRVCVLVGIDASEIPLVADAGADIEVEHGEKIVLDGRAVCRDDIASYEWREGATVLTDFNLPVGPHTLVLVIEDFDGHKAYDSVDIIVK